MQKKSKNTRVEEQFMHLSRYIHRKKILKYAFIFLLAYAGIAYGLVFSFGEIPFLGIMDQNPVVVAVIYAVAFSVFGMAIYPRLHGLFSEFFDLERPSGTHFGEDDNSIEIMSRIIALERKKTTGIEDLEIEEISANVSKQLSKDIDKNILTEIENKYQSEIYQNSTINSADGVMSKLIAQLERERSVVSTRTAINLTLGMVIAASGIWILYGTLTILNFESTDWKATGIHLVARLSVVIVVEIFAYFFLNLYKNGLQEIKYYRNEISNNMSRRIAIRLAIVDKSLATIPDLIQTFVDTERNFILKKGERTVLSDHVKNDGKENPIDDGTLLKSITAVLEKAKGIGSTGPKKP